MKQWINGVEHDIKPDANLRGADLRGANLVGAHLVGADLVGANLRGANLVGAKLAGAILPDGTKWVKPADQMDKFTNPQGDSK